MRGELIVRQGDISNEVYFVSEGEIEVEINGEPRIRLSKVVAVESEMRTGPEKDKRDGESRVIKSSIALHWNADSVHRTGRFAIATGIALWRDRNHL